MLREYQSDIVEYGDKKRLFLCVVASVSVALFYSVSLNCSVCLCSYFYLSTSNSTLHRLICTSLILVSYFSLCRSVCLSLILSSCLCLQRYFVNPFCANPFIWDFVICPCMTRLRAIFLGKPYLFAAFAGSAIGYR